MRKPARLHRLFIGTSLLLACSGEIEPAITKDSLVDGGANNDADSARDGSAGNDATLTSPEAGSAGNPDGRCAIPAEAREEDVSTPRTVVGDGSKASCTGSAFVAAVAKGGIITFNCGPDPVTITLDRTAKVVNDNGPKIVIDGGGKVTLSGGGKLRILYQNTCDSAQTVTPLPHCDNQDHPQLTVQNLTFIDGNARSEEEGGGAIFARGGRLKIVNSRFFNNVCADTGQEVGGGAVRAFDQFDDKPLYVVNSTFGGETKLGNVCSNGGALSSIGVSYSVINSDFSYNRAIGRGANPAQANTPGGGSGGAIYNDGGKFTLSLCGTKIQHNHANEGGGAVFFVSNDETGSLEIRDSTLTDNKSDKFETLPGIFVIAKDEPLIERSTVE